MYTVVPSRSLLLSPIHATTFPFLSLPRNLLTRLFLLLRPIVSFSSMVILLVVPFLRLLVPLRYIR